MRWRRVLWEGCQWGATMVALAVAALWIVSQYRGPSVIRGDNFFGLAKGGVFWQPLPSSAPAPWRPLANGSTAVVVGISADPRILEEITALIQLERLRNHGCCWAVSIGTANAVISLWPFVLAPGLVAGLVWGMGARRAARQRRGHCSLCDYDRRGLAADAKCPECGAAGGPSRTPRG